MDEAHRTTCAKHPVLAQLGHWCFLYGVPLVFILIGAVTFYRDSMVHIANEASVNWPAVTGIVRSSANVLHDRDDYAYTEPLVVYAYTVDSCAYTNDVYAYGARDVALDHVHDDSPITVYYNPENPAQAVLLPGYTANSDRVIALIFIVFGFLYLLQTQHMLRKSRKLEKLSPDERYQLLPRRLKYELSKSGAHIRYCGYTFYSEKVCNGHYDEHAVVPPPPEPEAAPRKRSKLKMFCIGSKDKLPGWVLLLLCIAYSAFVMIVLFALGQYLIRLTYPTCDAVVTRSEVVRNSTDSEIYYTYHFEALTTDSHCRIFCYASGEDALRSTRRDTLQALAEKYTVGTPIEVAVSTVLRDGYVTLILPPHFLEHVIAVLLFTFIIWFLYFFKGRGR